MHKVLAALRNRFYEGCLADAYKTISKRDQTLHTIAL